MSKRGLDYLTGSNASRTPFEIHFKAFESHLRNGADGARMFSNPFECSRKNSTVGGPPCLNRRPPPRAIRHSSPSWNPTGNSFANAAPSGGVILASLRLSGKIHGLSAAPSTIFSFVKVRAKRRRLYALPPSDDSPVFQSHPSKPQGAGLLHPARTKETQ